MTKIEAHLASVPIRDNGIVMTTIGQDASESVDLGGAFPMASVGGLLERIYEGHVVDGVDVARVSGTHPRTVARWQADAAVPRRDTEERLLELKAVIELLRRVMQDDAARAWLRTPNAELGYEKPLDLIASGQFRQVIGLVLAIAEGVTA